MQVLTILALVVCCFGIVLSQRPPQSNLYSFNADGFDTVLLEDMSFVTSMHWQANFTFYVFGGGSARTVFPGQSNFMVGFTPNDFWRLDYIDVRAFYDGNDTWFLGPINPFGFGRFGNINGYELDIGLVTNKPGFNFNLRYVTPIGFYGTFFAVQPVAFPFDPYVVAYFAGFFLSPDNSTLQFGVNRAHFNLTAFINNPFANNTQVVTFDPTVDSVAILSPALFTTFNSFYKPFLFHLFNSSFATVNTTYTYIVDPATNGIYLVLGNYNRSVPLTFARNVTLNTRGGYISSAILDYPRNLIIIGVGVPGIFTGSIIVFNIATFTIQNTFQLPTNFSDPRALTIDENYLFVGVNGGGAILRYSLGTFQLSGYQNLPRYLHQVWAGSNFPGDKFVYFVTNEQHSKVFRLAKTDFCSAPCMANGYCSNGNCVCSAPFVLSGGTCQYPQVVKDNSIISTEHGGEVALGVLFALSFVAAAGGWYLWWKGRNTGYQSV